MSQKSTIWISSVSQAPLVTTQRVLIIIILIIIKALLFQVWVIILCRCKILSGLRQNDIALVLVSAPEA